MPFKSSAIVSPNRGLYLNKPAIDIPPGALSDGMNFRIKSGVLSNINMGWEPFTDNWTLNGPVTFIDNFFPRDLDEQLMFGTTTDIYRYEPSNDSVVFLTPVYNTGTASASGTAVTGIGTTWTTNAAAGDEISFGASDETDPNATWYEIATVDGDTTLTLTATAGTVADGAYTLRRKFSGSIADTWSFDVFVNDATTNTDLWIATNGIDPIVSWNGSDDHVTLDTTMNFLCKSIANYSNMMIYGNITDGGVSFPTSIINSDVGKPLAAGDAGIGLSEQFRTHGGTDGIINMLAMGDYLVIYSDRHVVPMQFVGDPLVFVFREAVAGLGPVGYNAIADFGDFHEFIGADAQYVFDGVGIKESNSQVWREVIRQADPIRRPNIYGHFDEENGDLIWSIPLTTDAGAGEFDNPPEVAFSEHYLEEVPDDADTPHSKRAFPFTASGFYERNIGLTWSTATGVWTDYNFSWNDQFFSLGFPQNIVGDNTGNIFILNESQTADGTELPSYVRFNRWPSGTGRERNLLTRIYPFITELPGELNITVYGSDSAYGQLTGLVTVPYTMAYVHGVDNEYNFASIYRRARYFSVQFGTDGTAWQMAGWDYDLRKGGRR